MFKLICCNCGNEIIYKQVDNKVKEDNGTIYFIVDNFFGEKTIGCEKCGTEISDKPNSYLHKI